MTSERDGALIGAWRRRLGDPNDPVKAVLVLVIAGFTFLITALAALQVDAGAHSATAGRRADSIGASAAGRDAAAMIQTGTDLGVVRRWAETLFEAGWAQGVIERDQDSDAPATGDKPGDVQDTALATELLRIDRQLLAWAQEQSPLFAPPYFDGIGVDTDIARLDAERNVGPRARAVEERRVALAEAAAWSRRAGEYVTAITIVAAGLFFLGLAVALRGIPRRILAAAGIASGLVAIGAAVVVTVPQIPRVPAAAVDAIVEARMASGKTDWTDTSEVDERDRRDWAVAIAAAERAVAAAPDHPPSYLVRAEVKARFGDDLLLAVDAAPAEAAPLLEAALADYRHYTTLDRGSYEAWWNYGWVAYLSGDNETAIAAAIQALELSPDQFTLYLNRALARLSNGDVEGSRADVATALEVAGRSQLDSNAWFFAQTDYNLGRLAALRPTEAVELLAIQNQVRTTAIALRIGRPIGPSDGPDLERVGLQALALGPDGRLAPGPTIESGSAVPASSAVGLRLSLRAQGIPEGTVLSVRVRENGIERPAYRIDRPWPTGATEMSVDLVSPTGRIGSTLNPNEYSVEVYLDAVTKAAVPFVVSETTAGFKKTASQLVDFLASGGQTCADPAAVDGGGSRVTCLTTGTDRDVGTETMVSFDATDAITSVSMSQATPIKGIEDLFRQLAALVMASAVDDAIAGDVREWIGTAAPGASTRIGGANLTLSVAPDDGPRMTIEAAVSD